MNIFKRIYLYLLFHQRKYNKILKKTAFKESQNLSTINTKQLSYQAICSFYTKNYFHSQLCLEELIINRKRYSPLHCNLLSYIYSRHNKKEKAITTWCLAQEKNNSDRISADALEYIRQQGRNLNMSDDETFDSFIPKEPLYIPFFFLFKLIILLSILSGIGIGIYWGTKRLFKFYTFHKENRKLLNIELEDFNPNILSKQKDKNKKYSYSEEEIKKIFDNIKELILQQKVVKAQIEINKIKMSNASSSVKMKMEILQSFIDEPDYGIFKNKISYKEFIKEPNLYANIYILWKGRVINRKITKNKITFNFEIGNQEEGLIEGIIPVVFKKAAIIKNNDIIGLFGKIKHDEKNQTYYIEGFIAIRNYY